jgi:hypothetical protein
MLLNYRGLRIDFYKTQGLKRKLAMGSPISDPIDLGSIRFEPLDLDLTARDAGRRGGGGAKRRRATASGGALPG